MMLALKYAWFRFKHFLGRAVRPAPPDTTSELFLAKVEEEFAHTLALLDIRAKSAGNDLVLMSLLAYRTRRLLFWISDVEAKNEPARRKYYLGEAYEAISNDGESGEPVGGNHARESEVRPESRY